MKKLFSYFLLFAYINLILHISAAGQNKQPEYITSFKTGKQDLFSSQLQSQLKSNQCDLTSLEAWIFLHKKNAATIAKQAGLPDEVCRLIDLNMAVENLQLSNNYNELIKLLKEQTGDTFYTALSIRLVISALYKIDPLFSESIIYNYFEAVKKGFNIIRAYDLLTSNNIGALRKLQERLNKNEFASNPALESGLKKIISWQPLTATDRVFLAKEYMATEPSDGFACRYLADNLYVLEHYNEAADTYFTCFETDPFTFENNLLLAAKAKLMMQKTAETDSLIAKHCKLYSRNNENENFRFSKAQLLNETGNLGAAMELLNIKFTDSVLMLSVQKQKADLLENVNKYEQGTSYYSEKVKASSREIDDYMRLIDLYNKDSAFEKSLEVATIAKQRFTNFPEDFFYKEQAIYGYLKDDAARLNILYNWTTQYPYSAWGLKNLSFFLLVNKKTDSAFFIAAKIFEMFGADDRWLINQLLNIRKAVSSTDQAFILDSLIRLYPGKESLWEARADAEKNIDSKLTVWEKAITENKLSIFPYSNIVALSKNNINQLYNSIERFENMKPAFEDKDVKPGLKAEYLSALGSAYIDLLQKQVLPEEILRKVIGYMNDYDKLYGYESTKYVYSDDLYAALGKEDSSKLMLEESLKYKPDEENIYWNLWTKYRHKNKVALYKKYTDRNPYDAGRLASYIQLNTMWTGSALEAIRNTDIFQKRFPQSDDLDRIKDYKYQSLSHLGDNIDYYVNSYKGTSSIAKSERYIDWFYGAVRNLRKGSNKVVPDSINCSATIYFEDGTEAKYADDCNCGKVKIVAVGPSFIQFTYNNNCDLADIYASDGYRLTIGYDNKGNIISIKSPLDEELKFHYNTLNKADLLITGKDTLFVKYNEEGEVQSTSSNGGRQIATKIAAVFSKMNEKLRIPSEASNSIIGARLPDLGLPDKKYDSLRKKMDANTVGSPQWISTALNFSRYLANNLKIKSSYGPEAVEALEDIFNASKGKKLLYNYTKDAIDLFYSCMIVIRKSGVAVDYWNTWVEMQEWLKKVVITEKNNDTFFRSVLNMMDKYNKNPVILLNDSKWLQKSDLKNAGFWRDIYLNDIFPQQTGKAIRPTGVYFDMTGKIWLATSLGLFIDNNGSWDHFAYDMRKQRFIKKNSLDNIFASSYVNDIVFANDTTCFIATNDGLYKITGNIQNSSATEKLSELTGLYSNTVNALAFYDSLLWIATKAGLQVFDINSSKILHSYFQNTDVAFIRLFNGYTTRNELGKNYNLLTGIRSQNIYATELNEDITKPQAFDELYSGNYDFAGFEADGRVVYSVRDKIFVVNENKESRAKFSIELSGNIMTTEAKQVFGITQIPVINNDNSLSVLTDRGISIYRDRHFEHLDIPNSDNRFLSAEYLAKDLTNNIAVVSGDRISLFEKGNITYTKTATDILTLDSVGMTIVATGGSLSYFNASDNKPKYFPSDYSDISTLVRESDTSFLANSGYNIIRFMINKTTGAISELPLFYCEQTESPKREYVAGPVKNILIDRSGVIWVTTGLSIFRYDKTDKDTLTEYGFFKDPSRFPSYTHMIYRIIETLDRRIWVICSDERHLFYRGIKLAGGLLQWDKSKKAFVNLQMSKTTSYELPFNWFITSYTPIDSARAIIGTLNGFAEDYYGNIRSFNTDQKAENAQNSYSKIKQQHPSLFLGTKGVNIGNIWLFGCAEGVVCYTNGNWYYPERFNQLLPDDQEYGQYGGRLVHAISVDKYGRIFISTDLGTMVYNSGGSDGMSFLFRNFSSAEALIYQNQNQLQNEAAVVLNSIPRNSPSGALLDEYNQNQTGLLSLERKKSENQKNLLTGIEKKVSIDSLSLEQEQIMKKQVQLLLQLEQKDPALFQLLKVPPVDLLTSRKKLKDNECLIQYIPMSNGLGIQFISGQKVVFREIKISQKQLMDSVMKVVSWLSGRNPNDTSRGITPIKSKSLPAEITLGYLYSILIRPVLNDIRNIRNVYIIPYGKLYYLPFSALAYESETGSRRYLVEDHNIGFISTLSLFDLIAGYKESTAIGAYLFADPDGTLPFARQEIDSIKTTIGSCFEFVGKEATVEQLERISDKCKILHLATHGHLEKGKIEQSWILFADKKLTMADIFITKLPNVEMVVLSTCESSLGAEGIEYATLARAFTNSGVPTVVSTLWEINDQTTQEIMTDFYKAITDQKNKFEALAIAQRNFLERHKTDTKKLYPFYWAPFIVLGRP